METRSALLIKQGAVEGAMEAGYGACSTSYTYEGVAGSWYRELEQ
jgi:hypothetical protein